MNLFFASTAHAMGAAGGAGAEPVSPLVQFMPLILVAAIFYFLLIRPQQKEAKDRKALIDALKRGDEIVTSGGIYGRVSSIDNDVVTIEVAQNVKIRIKKHGITEVVKKTSP